MVDEKRLIEEIEKIFETDEENIDCTLSDFAYHVFDCIKEQPKVGEWIPCSERLPEKHVDVLVDFGDENPIIAWYSSVNDTWKNSITDHVIHIDAVAWMPLPEPYKGE